jgi:small ligand-binding sensory domain FIST
VRPVRPVRLGLAPGPLGPDPAELEPLRGAEGTLVVLADAHTAPVELLVSSLAELAPDLLVVGGTAAASRRPGGDRLVLDGALHTGGLVGALLAPEVPATALVSQGCRPIGTPLTVTASERNVIVELAGRPALERLLELVDTLPPEERALAARELYLGRVVDDHRLAPGAGDFLARHVLGADRERGAIAVGDEIPLGATVQFQLRDVASASADLAAVLARVPGEGAALVFTSDGRGTRLFGVPDHDATTISEHLGGEAVAGVVCTGEIGPVGGRSFLHALSATVLVLG